MTGNSRPPSSTVYDDFTTTVDGAAGAARVAYDRYGPPRQSRYGGPDAGMGGRTLPLFDRTWPGHPIADPEHPDGHPVTSCCHVEAEPDPNSRFYIAVIYQTGLFRCSRCHEPVKHQCHVNDRQRLLAAAQPACTTCEDAGVVEMEHQIGAPASGGRFTCPDCGPQPVERLDDEL